MEFENPYVVHMSSVELLFKISDNLLASKPFMLRKAPYFEQDQVCACLIYAFTYNLHTIIPKRHFKIKISTFLKKNNTYLQVCVALRRTY